MEAYRTRLTTTEIKHLENTMDNVKLSECSLLLNYYNREHALKNIIAMSERHNVVKYYQGDKFCGILCFHVSNSWWTTDVIVEEVFVFAVNGFKGLQRYAIKTLNEIAKDNKASMIVSGCFFQKNPAMVANGYKKQGFTETYPYFVKVIKNE